MHFVYIIQSQQDGNWYTGYTQNIANRLALHNAGNTHSTRARRPFDLIYYEMYVEKMDALGRERFLKSGAGHRFIHKQLTHFLRNKKFPSSTKSTF